MMPLGPLILKIKKSTMRRPVPSTAEGMENGSYEDREVCYAALVFDPKPAAGVEPVEEGAGEKRLTLSKQPVHRYMCDQRVQVDFENWKKTLKQAGMCVFVCLVAALNIGMWLIATHYNSQVQLACLLPDYDSLVRDTSPSLLPTTTKNTPPTPSTVADTETAFTEDYDDNATENNLSSATYLSSDEYYNNPGTADMNGEDTTGEFYTEVAMTGEHRTEGVREEETTFVEIDLTTNIQQAKGNVNGRKRNKRDKNGEWGLWRKIDVQGEGLRLSVHPRMKSVLCVTSVTVHKYHNLQGDESKLWFWNPQISKNTITAAIETRSKHLLAVNTEGVILKDWDGQEKLIYKSNFRPCDDIAKYKSNIYIICGNMIHILNWTHPNLTFQRKSIINSSPSYGAYDRNNRILVHRRLLYISSSSSNVVSIWKLTSTGEIQFNKVVNANDKNELSSPVLCGSYRPGSVLVLDQDNRGIMIVTAKGELQLFFTLNDTEKMPRDVLIERRAKNPKMWFLMEKEKKIKIFNMSNI